MKNVFENSCIKGCLVYLVALVLLVVVSAAGIGGLGKKGGAVAQGTVGANAPAQSSNPEGAELPAETAPSATPKPQTGNNLPGFVIGIATSIAAPTVTPAPAPAPAIPAPAQAQAPSASAPASAPPPVAQPPAQGSYAPQTQAQGGEITGQSLSPFYIVQGGDTLSEIATRFGTTSGELGEINKLDDANSIWPGQLLYLPGSAPAPQSSAPPPVGDIAGGSSVPPPAGTEGQNSPGLPTMPNTGINIRP